MTSDRLHLCCWKVLFSAVLTSFRTSVPCSQPYHLSAYCRQIQTRGEHQKRKIMTKATCIVQYVLEQLLLLVRNVKLKVSSRMFSLYVRWRILIELFRLLQPNLSRCLSFPHHRLCATTTRRVAVASIRSPPLVRFLSSRRGCVPFSLPVFGVKVCCHYRQSHRSNKGQNVWQKCLGKVRQVCESSSCSGSTFWLDPLEERMRRTGLMLHVVYILRSGARVTRRKLSLDVFTCWPRWNLARYVFLWQDFVPFLAVPLDAKHCWSPWLARFLGCYTR